MLSRTADHLFWLSRYMERAENTARMLDVNYQTSLLPQSEAVAQVGWQGLLSISELLYTYQQRYGEIQARDVMDFMVKDESNPSSILSCLSAARENARAVRGKGVPNAEFVARGEADIAIQQIPELMVVKETVVIGPLPAEIQNTTVFAAGVLSSSKHAAEARELLDFLASHETAMKLKSLGFEVHGSH